MSELYKQGLNRNQQLLFPPSIDDYVDEDNSARAIDAYVELLDLTKLQFSNTRKSNRADGQKAYSPKLMLKIYIYGYLIIMKKTLDKDLTKIEQEIEKYLKSLEYSDQEKQLSNIINKLPKDLRKLKYQQEEVSKNLKLLEKMGKTQYNKTDPDATLMRKSVHIFQEITL